MAFSTPYCRVRLIATAVVISCWTACSPAAPTCTDQYGRGSTAFDGLDVSCDAVNTELRCQAIATNQHGLYVYCPVQQDVTQVAVWAVDDVAVAAVVAPGTFHAAGTGDTVIRVAWQNLKASAKPVSVFPGTPPLPTQEISGSVYQTGKTVATGAIEGAVIQILNGLVAGRTATSGVPPPLLPGYFGPVGGEGFYRFVGVPPGAYRLRITKQGYISQERDVMVVTIGGPVANFELSPVP